MAQIAYWVAHLTSAWPGTPTGAQIAAGQLSTGSAASYSGSETGFSTASGTRDITESTPITGLTAGTSYTVAWVVYDDVALTYSNVVTGTASTLNAYTLVADNGSFTLTGQNAGLAFNRKLTADHATFALPGQDATLTYTPAGAYTLTADAGTFALSGQDANLLANRLLTADHATYALSGQDATLTYTPFSGAYSLTAEAGLYALNGQDADLRWSGEPTRTGGHAYLRSGFVQARKRLHLQRVLDFLTEDEPQEETKRIIREVKAGKPVPQEKKPPVVLKEVSAEKLAAKIKPERVAQLPPDIDLQQVIRRAIELAQEQDDEDILLLL